MSTAGAIRRMLDAGLTIEQALIAVAAFEAEMPIGLPILVEVEDDEATLRRRENDRKRQALRREACSAAEWASLRSAVFERDGYRCVYCGDDNGPFQADHVLPITRGGLSTLDNLACACASCNSSKQDKTLEEWRGRN